MSQLSLLWNMLQNNSAFCSLPWNHLTVRSFDTVSVGCIYLIYLNDLCFVFVYLLKILFVDLNFHLLKVEWCGHETEYGSHLVVQNIYLNIYINLNLLMIITFSLLCKRHLFTVLSKDFIDMRIILQAQKMCSMDPLNPTYTWYVTYKIESYHQIRISQSEI